MYQLRTLTPEPSNVWFAWWAALAVFLIGGFLTTAIIWLAVNSLGRAFVPEVFLLLTASGIILMAIGALGIRVCKTLGSRAPADRSTGDAGLRTFIGVGMISGAVGGSALGVVLGSVAVGLATGPLVGLVLGMAVWLLVRGSRLDEA